MRACGLQMKFIDFLTLYLLYRSLAEMEVEIGDPLAKSFLEKTLLSLSSEEEEENWLNPIWFWMGGFEFTLRLFDFFPGVIENEVEGRALGC